MRKARPETLLRMVEAVGELVWVEKMGRRSGEKGGRLLLLLLLLSGLLAEQ